MMLRSISYRGEIPSITHLGSLHSLYRIRRIFHNHKLVVQATVSPTARGPFYDRLAIRPGAPLPGGWFPKEKRISDLRMTDTVYKQLAERLDALPNGFTPTESGIELRLLAKIFTPEEARLASLLRLTHEPASEIALRAGTDPAATLDILKAMRRKGLISGRKSEGQ